MLSRIKDILIAIFGFIAVVLGFLLMNKNNQVLKDEVEDLEKENDQIEKLQETLSVSPASDRGDAIAKLRKAGKLRD